MMTTPPIIEDGVVQRVITDPAVLDMLVCPVTRGLLRYDRTASELVADGAGVAYPIKDGIPVMVEGQGRVIDPI
jgi:hypothetical protein